MIIMFCKERKELGQLVGGKSWEMGYEEEDGNRLRRNQNKMVKQFEEL